MNRCTKHPDCFLDEYGCTIVPTQNCADCQFEPQNGHAQTCPKYAPRKFGEPEKDWRTEFEQEYKSFFDEVGAYGVYDTLKSFITRVAKEAEEKGRMKALSPCCSAPISEGLGVAFCSDCKKVLGGEAKQKEWEDSVDVFIKKWCGENVAHLLDTDDNDGQRLRDLLSSHTAKVKKCVEGIQNTLPKGDANPFNHEYTKGWNDCVGEVRKALTDVLTALEKI